MKTIKDGLNEAYRKMGQNAYFGNGFEAGLKFAEEWIPVEEELPEHNKQLMESSYLTKYVIVKQKCPDSNAISMDVDRRYRPCKNIGFIWLIKHNNLMATHWRPIERF